MCHLRIINTVAYAQSVDKKKVRTKGSKAQVSVRQLKRKLSTYSKQNKVLRGKVSVRDIYVCIILHERCDFDAQVKQLQRQVRDLQATVRELKQGVHDIELEAGSQDDMVSLFDQCNTDPSLAANIKANDSTGTLALFWQEQRQRMTDPAGCKRKRWNPIVLRYTKCVGCLVRGGYVSLCVNVSESRMYVCAHRCVQVHATPLGTNGGKKLSSA